MPGFFVRRQRARLRARPFPSEWRAILARNVSSFSRLPPADQKELEGHIQIFLREKHWEGCGGLELTDEIRVTISAQACMLLLRRNADWILALGTRFSEADCSSWEREYTFNFPPTKLIHIDIDPAEIGRNYPVDIGAVADLRQALMALNRVARKLKPDGIRRPAVASEIAAARSEFVESNRKHAESDAYPMRPERILADVRAALPRNALITSLLRFFVFYVPLALIGNMLGGITGLFLGAALGNVLAGIVIRRWILSYASNLLQPAVAVTA